MSTTIKRVALVAVAALSLGVISVAPSSAAPSAAYGSLMGDQTLGQQEIGGLATVTISYNETITAVAVTGVGSVVSAVTATGNGVVSTPANGAFSITSPSATATDTGTVTLTLTSAVAGTQTITMTPFTASGSVGTAVTKTVTWVAALSKNTYDHSHAFIQGGNVAASTGTFLAADTNTVSSATAAITAASTPSASTPVAKIQVKQFAVGDTSTVSNLATGKGKEVTVAISGAGVLGSAQGTASASTITLPATAYVSGASQEIWVFADGRTGPASITVTVNGVLVSTKTVTFTGLTKKYALGTATADLLSKKYLGVGEASATVTFNGLDANNNKAEAAPADADFAITSDATVATATAVDGVVTIAPVKVGKATIYLANQADTATATIVSAGVDIWVTEKTAKTVTITFDKSSYNPGEKMTLTVTATDKNGNPVADGTRALLADSATANLNLVGSLPGASVDLVDGVAEYVLYAPATSGDLVITAKEGTATDSTTKVAITGTTSVVNAAADAATEAANEAAQAASDATDAALAAADAADAATTKAQEAVDAVATLSAEVTKLVTALKAQITTLSNLVTKIAKKVKA